MTKAEHKKGRPDFTVRHRPKKIEEPKVAILLTKNGVESTVTVEKSRVDYYLSKYREFQARIK